MSDNEIILNEFLRIMLERQWGVSYKDGLWRIDWEARGKHDKDWFYWCEQHGFDNPIKLILEAEKYFAGGRLEG